MDSPSSLLHPENLRRLHLSGKYIAKQLETRGEEMLRLTEGLEDPPLTILIRTRNNEKHLPGLLEDIARQKYDGPIELLVVDTESTDNTLEYARAAGAKIIPITQAEFSYPKSLNVGFEAASSPYVLTLVGHSNLASTYMFKAVTYWSQQPKFGGAYTLYVPNFDASRAELFFADSLSVFFMKPLIEKRSHMGLLAANASVVSVAAWKELGGYDDRYGAGGEDTALGRTMLAAGMLVAREPLLVPHHSHGLSFGGMIRQYRYWQRIAKPLPFDAAALATYRSKL